MRIAISGTANTGKSTLLSSFLRKWPMYATPAKTYRDVIKENKLNHSSLTNDETQLLILDWMMQELQRHPKDIKIIYDRCPWDNLAYSLYANQIGKVSDEVVAATISFVKESMKNLDIIFWIKRNPSIKVVSDEMRDTNLEIIEGVDEIFNSLYKYYCRDIETDVFYPKNDCPCIIPIDEYFPTVDDRLNLISQYLDPNGELIETDPKDSILNIENIELYESFMKDQEIQMKKDQEFLKLCEDIKEGRK